MYYDPNLPAEQAKEITELLDQLAGTVIYSRQHYLEPAYSPAGRHDREVAQNTMFPGNCWRGSTA